MLRLNSAIIKTLIETLFNANPSSEFSHFTRFHVKFIRPDKFIGLITKLIVIETFVGGSFGVHNPRGIPQIFIHIDSDRYWDRSMF